MSRHFPTHASLVTSIQGADDAWKRGDWASARDAYTEILRARLEDLREQAKEAGSGFRAVDLVVVERLADLAVPFGQRRAADRLLEGYIMLAAKAGNLMAADYAALKRVRLALGHGSINEALEKLQAMERSIGDLDQIELNPNALLSWEAARPWSVLDRGDQAVLYSRFYLELGRLFASLGQYADALAALDRGLGHATAPRTPDLAHRAELPLRLDRAAALLERGDMVEARAALADLEGRPALRAGPDMAIRLGELAGKLAVLTGDLGEARRRLEWVVGECRARGFHRAAAVAALNLAHLLIPLNQTARARALINEAVGLASVADGDNLLTVRARLLARLAGARGVSLAGGVAIAPAVTHHWRGHDPTLPAVPRPETIVADPVLDDEPQTTNYLAFFEDRSLDVLTRLAAGDPASAARGLDNLNRCFEATDSALIHLRLRVLRGVSDYYLGHHDQAAARLFETTEELSALGLYPELWQALRVLGWSQAKRNRPREEIEALSERAQTLLDAMTRSLSEEDRPILLLNKWTSEEEYIVSRIDILTREREEVDKSPWLIRPWMRWKHWKHLDDLLRFLDRFKVEEHRQGVGKSGSTLPGRVSAPAPLWRRLWQHSGRRAVVSFVVLPDRVFLACSLRGRLDFGVSPLTRLQVREKVRASHDAVRNSDDPTTLHKADAVLSNLAESLQIGSLLDRLPKRVRSLTIVPDDSLHGFPFAVLKHQGAWLIERFALSLGISREPGGPPSSMRKATGALLVGVSRGSGSIPPLPGVSRELDLVQRRLARPWRKVIERLEDDRADREAVLAGLGSRRFAHLACHGIFRPDRPDRSGLVLIPAPGCVELLSLRDLADADLSNLLHATLSACWSADGFILPGRRVISLPETLCRSGVKSVLGSLWPVDDATASALMDRFYTHLARRPLDEALRLAQLDMIKGRSGSPDPFSAHPIAWAGFTLTGRA